jgi:hypothetical protein
MKNMPQCDEYLEQMELSHVGENAKCTAALESSLVIS